MNRKRSMTTLVAALATLGAGTPAAVARTATDPVVHPVVSGPSCPDNYSGPTNLATGCPWYLMTYTVAYPGRESRRMPPGWIPPFAA